jgi:hypothetical protein
MSEEAAVTLNFQHEKAAAHRIAEQGSRYPEVKIGYSPQIGLFSPAHEYPCFRGDAAARGQRLDRMF